MFMLKKQEGMTGISIMILVAAIVFVASILLKIVPVYVDDSSVKSVVASFHGKSDMGGRSKRDVLAAFNKRLRINNVTSITDEFVSLSKSDGNYVLVVEYEPRGNLMGSLEYIVSFRHEAVFTSQ